MRSTIGQVLFVLGALLAEYNCTFNSDEEILLKMKRSPLEVGFVAFTETPLHVGHKLIKTVNSTMKVDKLRDSHHHIHTWIPGHVRHHAYIPAHLDRLYSPTHALLVERTVETVLVQPEIYQPYRSHYGGFGIGTDTGGQGAGHGYHVLFNL